MKKTKKKNNKENLSKKIGKKISFKYKSLCYQLIGKQVLKNQKLEYIGDQLIKADMKLTPAVYLSLIIITGLLTFIVSLLMFTIVFYFIIQTPSWILYVLILTTITTTVAFTFLPFVVRSRISTRRVSIERELPFTLSELSILASTGLTPIRIFRNMIHRNEHTAMNFEFKKIIYKVDIDGKDIITAVSETAKETPSPTFREVLWDIGNMIHQGGDLDVYLRNKADTTMQLKRDLQKEFTEKLGMYSELYLSLVLIGVLFIAIAAFILDAMGSSIAGLPPSTLLLFLSFGLIPIAVIVINVMVSMAYSKTG